MLAGPRVSTFLAQQIFHPSPALLGRTEYEPCLPRNHFVSVHTHTMENTPLTSFLIVGGNPVSAFLSWRLSATNACDVTLVWKNGFESVAQYGLSFK